VPRIDFIYDRDCAHAEIARENLIDALSRALLPCTWTEYCVADADLPAYARGFGSPTVLIDTRDVAGAAPGVAPLVRLYDNHRGAPSVEQILAALETALRLAS